MLTFVRGRWVLISFKREFPFDDVLRLWEVGDPYLRHNPPLMIPSGTMDGLLLEELRPIRRTGRDGVSSRRDHAVFGGI
jgi:hypothetical protein